MVLNRLLVHVRHKPYTWLTGLLLGISSYLCLVNLDYALLWSDEANTAIIGNNFLQTGTLTAWDGRNLASNIDGMNVNSDAEEVLPPLQYILSAIGISIFGFNEVGVRIMHAFIGVLALVMLLLLLKLYLPNSPRLIFLIMLFVCLSPQLLLYFRSARYFSFAVFSFISCIYFYEQYWRSGSFLHLISLTAVGILSFLNNYSIGAAGTLAIAAYHLILRGVTNRKQFALLLLAALLITIGGIAYLYSAGVIPVDHGMDSYYGITSLTLFDHILKLWRGTKDILASDWLSWSICLWFFVHWLLTVKGKTSDRIGFTQAGRMLMECPPVKLDTFPAQIRGVCDGRDCRC